jgi:hypothetical protein
VCFPEQQFSVACLSPTEDDHLRVQSPDKWCSQHVHSLSFVDKPRHGCGLLVPAQERSPTHPPSA